MIEVFVVTDMQNRFVDVFATKALAAEFVKELRLQGRSLFVHRCKLEDA